VGICKNGIIDYYSHTVCCPKSCGVCGGYGCETRPGGANCCAYPIKASGNVCRSDWDTHCVIQAHPKCESGILSPDNKVCCPKECGRCAGWGCEKRPGGATKCCETVIGPRRVMCTSPYQTACNMPPLLIALAEKSDAEMASLLPEQQLNEDKNTGVQMFEGEELNSVPYKQGLLSNMHFALMLSWCVISTTAAVALVVQNKRLRSKTQLTSPLMVG